MPPSDECHFSSISLWNIGTDNLPPFRSVLRKPFKFTPGLTHLYHTRHFCLGLRQLSPGQLFVSPVCPFSWFLTKRFCHTRKLGFATSQNGFFQHHKTGFCQITKPGFATPQTPDYSAVRSLYSLYSKWVSFSKCLHFCFFYLCHQHLYAIFECTCFITKLTLFSFVYWSLF